MPRILFREQIQFRDYLAIYWDIMVTSYSDSVACNFGEIQS